MRKIESIEELMKILESGEYSYFGLRGAYEDDLELAESRGYLNRSYVWEDGEQTDELLNGTCAIGISEYTPEVEIMTRIETARIMYSEIGTVLLIADKVQEYGNDDNEVILGDGYGADVIGVVAF